MPGCATGPIKHVFNAPLGSTPQKCVKITHRMREFHASLAPKFARHRPESLLAAPLLPPPRPPLPARIANRKSEIANFPELLGHTPARGRLWTSRCRKRGNESPICRALWNGTETRYLVSHSFGAGFVYADAHGPNSSCERCRAPAQAERPRRSGSYYAKGR